MKIYNENHDTVIQYRLKSKTKGAKTGEIVPHEKIVDWLYFFKEAHFEHQQVFIKIELSKKMILDLAKEIQSIESETIDFEIIDLPF